MTHNRTADSDPKHSESSLSHSHIKHNHSSYDSLPYPHHSSSPSYLNRNDAERVRKKFRDAIYVGNFERVERIIKNIIENNTLDISNVLLPYASRHVTPIGLAARRGHLKILKILVQVIKKCLMKQLVDEPHKSSLNWDSSSSLLELLSLSRESSDREVVENPDNNDTPSDTEQPGQLSKTHSISADGDDTKDKDKRKTNSNSNPKKKAHTQPSELDLEFGLDLGDNSIFDSQPSPFKKKNKSKNKNKKRRRKPRRTISERDLSTLSHSMLNKLDGENRTALSHACEKGQIDVITYLLSQPDIEIEAGGKHHEESWSNLHWACRYGHPDIVQLLLDNNAEINAQTSKKRSTGLHLACATGHTEVIDKLLRNGAAKELEDVYGCSPLSLAIHFGEKKVQQILYEAGIFVSQHDARRLKKDNHVFRRFGWIKIAPSINTAFVLPDDVWCIICGYLPCRELLLNVRLVSFGFLHVVHHPALRKLVNFRKSLPKENDERFQYNENHQTLILKVPPEGYEAMSQSLPFVPVLPPFNPMLGIPPLMPIPVPLPAPLPITTGLGLDNNPLGLQLPNPLLQFPTALNPIVNVNDMSNNNNNESAENNARLQLQESENIFSLESLNALEQMQRTFSTENNHNHNHNHNHNSNSNSSSIPEPMLDVSQQSRMLALGNNENDNQNGNQTEPRFSFLQRLRRNSNSNSNSNNNDRNNSTQIPRFCSPPTGVSEQKQVEANNNNSNGNNQFSLLFRRNNIQQLLDDDDDDEEDLAQILQQAEPVAGTTNELLQAGSLNILQTPVLQQAQLLTRNTSINELHRSSSFNDVSTQLTRGYSHNLRPTENERAIGPNIPPLPLPMPNLNLPLNSRFQQLVQSHNQLSYESATSEQKTDITLGLQLSNLNELTAQVDHSAFSPTQVIPMLDENKASTPKPQWKIEEEEHLKKPWTYLHCEWLGCAVNFGPSSLRKIRLNGESIITQPLIRVLSCLSFIVHLELAHFHAYRLTLMDLSYLKRVSQLKMIRQLKVFPIIRNNSYKTAHADATAVAEFITSVGSTALTLGIRYENVSLDAQNCSVDEIELLNKKENALFELRKNKIQTRKESKDKAESDDVKDEEMCEEDLVDFETEHNEIDMWMLSSVTWKSLFENLSPSLRSLRLHFGKDDNLKSGAVKGLQNFESIKCFTLHGDPGLRNQIQMWSHVFKRWNKLRYIVLGHRNNSKELEVPKEILQALPPMLPELALNISVHSIPNVVWYLGHVVQYECFLRINLHVVYKHKADLYHTAINPHIIECLTKFVNLETAYLKCGMVTLAQIRKLLTNCKKISFVGFGIDVESSDDDEVEEQEFRVLLQEFGFDKIVVKKKINWLIAVKSYDKLLLDQTRCIHPVLEAFDDKSVITAKTETVVKSQPSVDLTAHILPL